jgi:hypothetical protein
VILWDRRSRWEAGRPREFEESVADLPQGAAPERKRSADRFREKDKQPLIDFFDCTDSFVRASITTYGIERTIDYCCVDLLWKPIKSLVRFVLVIDGKDRYILMYSDLELDPVRIVMIYSYRAKIETMVLVIKHLVGAFSYHFWTKAHPVLKRGQSLDPSALCVHKDNSHRIYPYLLKGVAIVRPDHLPSGAGGGRLG